MERPILYIYYRENKQRKGSNMANSNLTAAKTAKNDEFYTELSEIQAELRHYSDKFCGKTVFCNCDDPFESNFVKYFLMNFNRLGLKELIATGYKTSPIGGSEVGYPKSPYVLRVKETKRYLVGDQTDLDVRGAKWLLDAEGSNIMTPLIGNLAKDKDGNQIMEEVTELYLDEKTGKEKKRKVKHPLYYEAGDFRSDISIELLKESDIVVTNPPFSLFREYVAQLMEYEKQFLILGSLNAITYKEIFPLLKNNQIWLGCQSGSKTYVVPESFAKEFPNKTTKQGNIYVTKMGNTGWFTNIDHAKRHQMLPLDLGFTYAGHEEDYPRYDNYDAINVDKVSQIPCDYMGVMGVPITFLDKYCPEQFEILGDSQRGCHDNFPELRTYDDYREKFPNGKETGSSGSKTNGNPNLLKQDGIHNYFENDDGRIVQSCYNRVFIRRK